MSDLISRDDAKRIIDNIDTFCAGWRDYAKEQIDSSPTAEKVGKWIRNEDRYGWHCSACEEDDLYAFAWNSYTGENELQDHYCPNCGARMKGEKDDN